MELHPGPGRTVTEHDVDDDGVFLDLMSEIVGGYYVFLHFGTPCSHWASLSHMNGGSRTT